MDDSAWHILRVRSGAEAEVAAASGVHAYVPMQRIQYHNRRLRKTISYSAPILPGVVFVKISAPSVLKMRPMASFFGFMRNGDKTPSVLCERSFEALKALEIEVNKTPARFASGRKVSFEKGQKIKVPTASGKTIEALVDEIRGDKVLASIVGSPWRLEAKASDAIAA